MLAMIPGDAYVPGGLCQCVPGWSCSRRKFMFRSFPPCAFRKLPNRQIWLEDIKLWRQKHYIIISPVSMRKI